jgi:hypothetical protein
MATTTNYGWTTPDNTDLVKDGATAIRTLGSSIDTTTKNLNPSTTLGDIEYRSATANTNTRLGIGTTGQVLSVSGGVPAWATIASGGMTLLSTTSLSGLQTTVSSIDQTYTNLYILIGNMTGSTSFAPQIDPNATTGLARAFSNNGTVTNFANPGGTSFLATGINAISMVIQNYTSTSQAKPVQMIGSHASGTNPWFAINGIINTASAITSIRVTTVAGTTSIGGTLYIYGVK